MDHLVVMRKTMTDERKLEVHDDILATIYDLCDRDPAKYVHALKSSYFAEQEAIEEVHKLPILKAEEEEMLEKYGGGNRAAEKANPGLVTGHASMVRDMVDAVASDRDPQILPLEAIKSVRIVNAIYESARTGKTVYFD